MNVSSIQSVVGILENTIRFYYKFNPEMTSDCICHFILFGIYLQNLVLKIDNITFRTTLDTYTVKQLTRFFFKLLNNWHTEKQRTFFINIYMGGFGLDSRWDHNKENNFSKLVLV